MLRKKESKWKTYRNVYGFMCLHLLVVFSASLAWSQADPTKVLVGRWEGSVALPRDNGRIIIIRSVKPKEDGGWVAQGNYGIEPDKLGRMTFDVSVQNGEIIVDFVTSQKNPGRLKLVGDRVLEGTLNVIVPQGGSFRQSNRELKLEKVESKQESPK